MARAINDVRQGRRPYTASGTITEGMLVVPHTTADQVVATGASGPICMVASSDAATGTRVEVDPILRGAEYRFLAQGNIAAGAEVQFSATAGRVETFSAGTKVGRAQEAAATNGLVKVIVY
jgi:predicted RecA/RadA family phage recombinase